MLSSSTGSEILERSKDGLAGFILMLNERPMPLGLRGPFSKSGFLMVMRLVSDLAIPFAEDILPLAKVTI